MINNNNIHNYNSNIAVSLKENIKDSSNQESGLFNPVSQKNDLSKMTIELKINRHFLMRLIDKLCASISDDYAKSLEAKLDVATKFVLTVFNHKVGPIIKENLIKYIKDYPESFSMMLNEEFGKYCNEPENYHKNGVINENKLKLLAPQIQSRMIDNYNRLKNDEAMKLP